MANYNTTAFLCVSSFEVAFEKSFHFPNEDDASDDEGPTALSPDLSKLLKALSLAEATAVCDIGSAVVGFKRAPEGKNAWKRMFAGAGAGLLALAIYIPPAGYTNYEVVLSSAMLALFLPPILTVFAAQAVGGVGGGLFTEALASGAVPCGAAQLLRGPGDKHVKSCGNGVWRGGRGGPVSLERGSWDYCQRVMRGGGFVHELWGAMGGLGWICPRVMCGGAWVASWGGFVHEPASWGSVGWPAGGAWVAVASWGSVGGQLGWICPRAWGSRGMDLSTSVGERGVDLSTSVGEPASWGSVGGQLGELGWICPRAMRGGGRAGFGGGGVDCTS